MVILGIDPGLAQTGYGVVEYRGGSFRVLDCGLVRTSPRLPLAERVAAIHERFRALIALHHPQVLVWERLYALRDGSTGLAIGQAMGAILLAAHEGGLEVVEYTPTQVKQAVVGYGQATKEQVEYMVRQILGLSQPLPSHHAADALALCICHAHVASGHEGWKGSPVSPWASPRLEERIAAALEEDEALREAHRRQSHRRRHPP